ncbi:MAG TPA: AMP-binding protein [Planctomycetota bacterium]|nr:AMP-binding protein [Planctomycetota bacterium]
MTNLVELLAFAAERFGTRTFAVDAPSGRELSFSGLKESSACIAAALRERFGVAPGSHVAMLLPNCVEILPIYFGILRAGCVFVPINARLKADEFQFIVSDCEAQAVFVHPATWKPAREALKTLGWTKPVIAVGFDTAPEGTIALTELLVVGRAAKPVQIKSERDADGLGSPSYSAAREDVAAIIYTSGTTGRPKGAMLTHGNILFNIESTIAGHGLRESDVHLLIVPLFHVTGLNTIMPTALFQGSPMIVSASIDPEEVVEIVARYRCTTFFGVPTTFYLLANLRDLKIEMLASLRLICYSGAPMSPLTIQRLRELFPRVELHNFYGLTETTSVTTVLPDSEALARAESVGVAPPGLQLAVMDDHDSALPPGELGELCVKGPGVLKGYFKRPDATAEAIREGWFHTGDTAYMDSEGYVFLRGRKKEMIIVAGENVYPIEVENAICAHPAVQEAAVFGRPDPALGEVVHAAAVLRPGQTVSERELRAFLAPRLAGFKQPRTIVFLEKLPRNPSGKVMKRDLK